MTTQTATQSQYRVAWRSKATGATGHTQPISYAEAWQWRDAMNRKYPDLHHWIERVRPEKEAQQ